MSEREERRAEERGGEERRGAGADVMKPSLAVPRPSALSPPQQLSHHLPVLHYATFPCSFLSDIKGWCEFY